MPSNATSATVPEYPARYARCCGELPSDPSVDSSLSAAMSALCAAAASMSDAFGLTAGHPASARSSLISASMSASFELRLTLDSSVGFLLSLWSSSGVLGGGSVVGSSDAVGSGSVLVGSSDGTPGSPVVEDNSSVGSAESVTLVVGPSVGDFEGSDVGVVVSVVGMPVKTDGGVYMSESRVVVVLTSGESFSSW